jgi:uncharacterized protein
MIQKFLSWVAQISVRKPWQVIFWVVVPQVLIGFFVLQTPWDLSFGSLMNRHNPGVARYIDAIKEIKLGGRLFLLLEGEEAVFEKNLDQVITAIGKVSAVKNVSMPPSVNWLEQNAPYLVERSIFDAWLGAAIESDNPAHSKTLEKEKEKLDLMTRQRTMEGHRLIQVTTVSDPLDVVAGGADYYALEEATQAILNGYQLKGAYTGIGAVAAQDQSKTFAAMEKLTPFSFLVVLFLFWLVEPKPMRLLLVSVPMLLAWWATMGTVGLILGQLTIMESLFGIMIFGLGIDFSLHLMVRFREERANGKTYEEAVSNTIKGTGHGVFAGGLTTAGAFLIAGTAKDISMSHLGISGGFGLLYCLFGTLLLLPAFWTLFEQKNANEKPARKEFTIPLLPSLARLSVRHPVWVLGVTVLLSWGAYRGFEHQTFQTNLQKVFNRDVPAMGVADKIQSIFGINGSSWMVLADNFEEARVLAEKMKKVTFIDRVDSISDFVRSDAAERHQLIKKHEKEIDDQITILETMIHLSNEEEEKELNQGIAAMQILKQATSIGPPTLESLPPSILSLLQVEDGRYLIQGYSRAPALDGDLAKTERLAIEKSLPQAFSFNLLLEDMMARTRPWLIPVFLSIILFVAALLWWDLRKIRWVILALLPVLVGLLWTFGTLCWLRIPFNMLMIGVLPLVIGLGVDDGIHVVKRMQEDDKPSPDEAAISVGRAITMTTITTCSSFVVTLFANHTGLESMGKIMLLGLPICLLTSVMIIPALATLWRESPSA